MTKPAIDPSLLADREATIARVKEPAKARAAEIWDLALNDPAAYLALGDPGQENTSRDRSILSIIAPMHPALRSGR